METVIHQVGDLSAVGRSAAETLVGRSLAENQQLEQAISRRLDLTRTGT